MEWQSASDLAERLALVGVDERLLEQDAGEAGGLDADAPALVVEVVHDVLEALVLAADQILDGDLSERRGQRSEIRSGIVRALP